METFGAWLQGELGRRDLSVRRFAQKVGTSHTTVNGWIRGDRDPEREDLLRAAEVLQISPVIVGMAYIGVLPDGADARRLSLMRPEAQAEVLAAMEELIELVVHSTEQTRRGVADWAERWARQLGATGTRDTRGGR